MSGRETPIGEAEIYAWYLNGKILNLDRADKIKLEDAVKKAKLERDAGIEVDFPIEVDSPLTLFGAKRIKPRLSEIVQDEKGNYVKRSNTLVYCVSPAELPYFNAAVKEAREQATTKQQAVDVKIGWYFGYHQVEEGFGGGVTLSNLVYRQHGNALVAWQAFQRERKSRFLGVFRHTKVMYACHLIATLDFRDYSKTSHSDCRVKHEGKFEQEAVPAVYANVMDEVHRILTETIKMADAKDESVSANLYAVSEALCSAFYQATALGHRKTFGDENPFRPFADQEKLARAYRSVYGS